MYELWSFGLTKLVVKELPVPYDITTGSAGLRESGEDMDNIRYGMYIDIGMGPAV
jgi:hypothetical protein